MSGLPSGTVAVLMSDVVGSTAHWDAGADEAERALAALDDCIDASVRAVGGAVIKARGEGDSHFAVFDRASAAVRAAVAIQRCASTGAGVQVRIVVALAELDPIDGDYVGAAVNRIARIRGTAHGGQIVCTRPVVDVAAPLDGLEMRSLGTHRVRDIAEPVELFQLCGDGLPASFPPLRTLDAETSALMAVVYVDQVGSSRRANAIDLPSWQGPLYRMLRVAVHAHDGRHLKLFGDGGVVAFEDPRTAVDFAREVCGHAEFHLRAGVAVGLVTVVEGELTGLPFYEAANASKVADEGDVALSPMMRDLVAPTTGDGKFARNL